MSRSNVFSDLNETLFFWKDFGKITQMPKLKKMLPVGSKMLQSGGKIDGWAERH
jgi:hypothetical protein